MKTHERTRLTEGSLFPVQGWAEPQAKSNRGEWVRVRWRWKLIAPSVAGNCVRLNR